MNTTTNRRHRGCLLYQYRVAVVSLFAVVLFISLFFLGLKSSNHQNRNEPVEEEKYFERKMSSMAMDDFRLIKYVRFRYLSPPSDKEYNFNSAKKGEFSSEISRWARKFMKNKKNGIFIESGANEGELDSHTLELELDLGWTGLLVECNPTVVPYLKSKHRKAWVAGACLSVDDRVNTVTFNNPVSFTHSGRFGEPIDLYAMTRINTSWTKFDVETVPMYTILESIEMREVDFWVLDVEGIELGVLQHFPFDKIKVKLIVIEILFFSQSQVDAMNNLLVSKGYWKIDAELSKDLVYILPAFQKELELISETKGWI